MAQKRIPAQTIEKYANNALKRAISELFKVKKLKKFIPGKDLTVELTVCSSSKMAEINGDYRNKHEPTDVLSFPAADFFWKQGVLGDLVLCAPILLRQAREQKHSWKVETEVLLVHGLLHLLGFDHEKNARAAKVMAELERALCKALGHKKNAGLIKRATKNAL